METDVFGDSIRNRELLRRIQQARGSQRRHDPRAELHDPVGENPRVRPIVRAVWRRAEKESMVLGMGRCHDVPARMVSVLKPRHGIPRVS